MPSFNRRRFGKIVAGAAAALPLAAISARPTPVAAAPGEAAGETDVAAASPLTSAQLEQYRKRLPDQSKDLDKLHGFELGYGYEPDFVFRAVGPSHASAHPAAHHAPAKAANNG